MHCQVIGAGLLGLTSAWFLGRLGYQVSVYEAGEEVGLGTSYGNGGMLHASEANPWNHPGIFWEAMKMLGREDSALLIRPYAVAQMLPWIWSFFRNSSSKEFRSNLEKNARLAKYSLDVLKDELLGLQLDFDYKAVGTLKIYSDFGAFNTACVVADEAKVMGTISRVLECSELAELEPALEAASSNLVGGIYYPDDASGDANKFCKSLADACRKAGITILRNSEVDEIVIENDRFCGLRVRGEIVAGEACIVAAGCHSKNLIRAIGIKLPVEPVKGYSITLAMEGWDNYPKIPVIDEFRHAAVCPLGSRLRIAGTAEFAAFNSDMPLGRINNLFDVCQALYPFGDIPNNCVDASPWFGYRPMTPDGVAVVSRTDLKGLYLNTGHGHLGWTMAPGSGKLLADIISNSATTIPEKDYRLSRF